MRRLKMYEFLLISFSRAIETIIYTFTPFTLLLIRTLSMKGWRYGVGYEKRIIRLVVAVMLVADVYRWSGTK